MPRKIFIYKREELYDQVWATPMIELAKSHGISDVALAKICKKLGVPRPGRGYWARKSAGAKVKKKPLRSLKKGELEEYRIERWIDPLEDAQIGEEATLLLQKHEYPANEIQVAKELQNPHKLIRKSAGALRRRSKSQDLLRQKRPCLDITASRGSLDRALCVMDALLKALETLGLRVELTDPEFVPESGYGRQAYTKPSETRVRILDSVISFGIEECVDITKTEPKRSSDDSWFYSPRPEYHHEPNGKLALKLKSHVMGVRRKTWADGNRQRIEDCLHPFVTEIILGAERERQDRLEQERQRRIREEELRRQREAERVRQIEAARIEDLHERFGKWDLGNSLADFIVVVETAAREQDVDTSPDSDLGNWLRWAHSYVAGLKQAAVKAPKLKQ